MKQIVDYDSIARAVVELLNNEPFYGHILANMKKFFDPSPKTPTLSVGWDGKQIELRINPDFWNHMKSYRIGLLKHEILHIVFSHLSRAQDFDRYIANIAMDMVVNQNIKKKQLPSGLVSHKDFGYDDNLTFEEYYKKLMKDIAKARSKLPSYFQQGSGQGQGQGQCPNCGQQQGQGQQPQQSQGGGGNQCPNCGTDQNQNPWQGQNPDDVKQIDSHGDWKEAADNVVAQSQIREMVRRAYDTVDKSKIPGSIAGAIEELLKVKKGKLPWQQLLRQFMFSCIDPDIIYTKKRRSKRYKTFPGTRIEEEGVMILLAFDTSGSISSEQLSRFFGELQKMKKNVRCRIDLIECDVNINNVTKDYKEFNADKLCAVHGRGGTSLIPPFEFAAEKHIYDCLIYCTDGYGQAPSKKPRIPTLWVETADGEIPVDWGYKITIDD